MSDLQRQASDPEYSVWVAASAGTGKTKILTDRVLRLLIKGAEFKNILCLTFTNAAALEMQTRISNKLRNFALADVSKLEKELFLITGEKPLASEIANAQTLYHRLLNTDAPLNIYTIHAFCQKILKSFPLEAGVTPEFQILDDSLLQDIFLKIKSEIYLNPTHHSLINFLLSNFHETTIQDIFDEIITQKIKFKELTKGLELSPRGLTTGSRKNSKKLDAVVKPRHDNSSFTNSEVNNELSAAKQLSHMYDNIKSLLAKYSLNTNPQELFFTKDGSKRKSIFSKELQKQYPKLLVELENISTEIYRLDQLSKAEEITYYSTLLINLAQIFLKKYEQYKLDNNFLDYDDLIYYTKLLLSNDNIEWVLHKLEGEIHHILIDEAQDTAPDQWAIISAIITEFNTSAKSNSSIFVVGDEKQSIFSFQGANLTIFNNINNVLKDNLAKANKKFKNITLEWSYRSTEEILQVVHKVLKQIKIDNPSLFIADNPLISSFRKINKSHNGSVELWPLVVADKKEELFWSLPEEYNKSLSSAELLIEKITNFIKDQIKSKRILPSTGQEITARDFMILVRKRDEFSNGLINHLKRSGLTVEGSDRVTLKENLSVMDLTAIAKFILLPNDDLNLASLLKSPIIGMSEEQLYELALRREECFSLWATLFDNILLYKNIYEKLSYLIEIYQTSNAGNFFISVINNLNLREILNTANGADSDDAINELLSLSADYAHKIDNSLQGFIAWFENNDIKIKRDIEHSDKIRIMTVHGSKGLQSPIVILCDNTIMPINKNKFIWTEEGEVFFSTQTSNSPDFFKDLKEQEQQKDIQEYIRLLYVAMTRAEDHLIICGYSNKAKIPENCWYELIAKSMY